MDQEGTVAPPWCQVHQPLATSVTLKKTLGFFGEELLMNGKMCAKRRRNKLRYSYSLLKFFLLSHQAEIDRRLKKKNWILVLPSCYDEEVAVYVFFNCANRSFDLQLSAIIKVS